jgi:chromosome segregation ATPase
LGADGQDEKVSLEREVDSAKQQAVAESKRAAEAASALKEAKAKNADLEAQLTRARNAKTKDATDLKALRHQLQTLKSEKTAAETLLAKTKEEVDVFFSPTFFCFFLLYGVVGRVMALGV